MAVRKSVDPLGDLGHRIAELRRAKGMTQAEFAARADVSLQYIARVEQGGANLTVRSLTRFAGLLDVDVGSLFVAPKPRKPGPGRPRHRDGAI